MAVKQTTQVGNKVIRTPALYVKNPKAASVKKVIADLVDSMRHHELVGMAAPQIGKGIQVFVTEIRETKLRKGDAKSNVDPLRVFINPKVISISRTKALGWEGCGSVAAAGLFAMVKRPDSITLEATNEHGETFRLVAKNLLARVIQHEIDHLNGVVFTDKADQSTYMSRDEYLKLRAKKTKK